MSANERRPAGAASEPHVTGEVAASLPPHPDSLHRSPVGVVRHLVLSVDILDVGILTALTLVWPVAWWSA